MTSLSWRECVSSTSAAGIKPCTMVAVTAMVLHMRNTSTPPPTGLLKQLPLRRCGSCRTAFTTRLHSPAGVRMVAAVVLLLQALPLQRSL